MKTKKYIHKIISFLLIFYFVIFNTNFAHAENSEWSSYVIADFLHNKVESPCVFIYEKYDQPITREEFVQVIVGVYTLDPSLNKESIHLIENPFTDTKNVDVQRAFSLGFMDGKTKNKFYPKQNITRQEIATIITRFLSKKGIDTTTTCDLKAFSDNKSISNWAYPSLAYCVENQIIEGFRNNLNPKKNITIEESLTILDRICLKYGWFTPSKDKYVHGYLTPRKSEIQVSAGYLTEIELSSNWKNIKDFEKLKKDMIYTLKSKLENIDEVEQFLNNATIDDLKKLDYNSDKSKIFNISNDRSIEICSICSIHEEFCIFVRQIKQDKKAI